MLYNEKPGILVVDDEEIILNVLRRLLRKQGFKKIVTALNGSQALKFIQEAEEPFFLVISDQNMPEMSGNELLEEVVKLTPDSRRILMTGYADVKSAIEAINRGAIHKYILKPWDNDEILGVVLNELNHYMKIQEKIKLSNFTKKQNVRLFKVARTRTAQNKAFKEEIRLKFETKAKLEKDFKALWAKADADCLGLEGFLARTNVMGPDTFLKAFLQIRNQIALLIQNGAKRAGFSMDPDFKNIGHAPVAGHYIDDKLYEAVDKVIQQACRLSEPALIELGLAAFSQTGADPYTQIPGIIELAFADGYITQANYDRALGLIDATDADHARGDLDSQKAYEPDKSIEALLLDNGFISRTDLSKTLVKRSMIKMGLTGRGNVQHPVSPGDKYIAQSGLPVSEKQHVFDFEISDSKTKVYLKLPKGLEFATVRDSSAVELQLYQMGIKYGIVNTNLLTGFLKHSKDPEKRFVVALGLDPIPGEDARIEYFFNTDYQLPGVVADDGTIDFCDRGEIPFALKGDLLARKILKKKGTMGMDVFGRVIPVLEAEDVSLKAGNDVIISRDGLEVYAGIDGKPCLDSRGAISMFKQLIIKGNVGFQTGHVNFQGHVFVIGGVNEGFKVRCVDLTVNEINGGDINLSGNLNVSRGIFNAKVKILGTIRAKFINHSVIESLGDVRVMREIMGSEIITSGEFINIGGRITASTISARKGMTLEQVGTNRAERSTLRVGVDDYMDCIKRIFDPRLMELKQKINDLHGEKQALEEKNFLFHKQVADQAFVEDNLNQQLNVVKKQCLESAGKRSEFLVLEKRKKEIERDIAEVDKKIKEIFAEQDELMEAIEKSEGLLEEKQNEYQDVLNEMETIKKFAQSEEAVPIVKISKRILAGTLILGPSSSMVVKDSLGSCRIAEIDSHESGGKSMVIQAF